MVLWSEIEINQEMLSTTFHDFFFLYFYQRSEEKSKTGSVREEHVKQLSLSVI